MVAMIMPLSDGMDIHFTSLHKILRNLYDQMAPLTDDIATFATALAGLGALLYISYRVWQALARAEAIDVFSLLRPFVIGLCIISFRPIVVNSINGILKPLVVGTNQILKNQLLDMKELQKKKNRLEWEEAVRRKTYGVIDPNEDYDAELRALGLDVPTQSVMDSLYEVTHIFSTKYWVLQFFRWLLEILFGAAALVIDTLRTFYLVILTILGPIAFALSVFDGLQNTLIQWLARYISVYLWLPVSDLFGAMLAKIQTLILQEEMNLMADPMSIIDVDGSSAIYLIFMVIGIIGYFCVPTVSNWIVQAGGMSSYNRNVNNTASKVTNVAGAAAGASTGNVGAVLLKK